MAKPARGLPADYSLDLPDDKPVHIGDFLDEEPVPVQRKAPRREAPTSEKIAFREQAFRPEVIRDGGGGEKIPTPRPQRYQLNLTPKSKAQLDELVQYIRTYSPQTDARTSEVLQAITTLLHNAMHELELAELPRRGAWGSVTAENFPAALGDALELAILRGAQKRGRR